jgi:putative acetyltransferase
MVRPAEPTDLARLCRLYQQLHVVRGTSAPPFASPAKIRAWLKQIEGGGHLLVAAAGPVVSGALALKTFGDPMRRHTGEIGWVAVDVNWQGRGVGSLLVEAALDLADNWLRLARVELLVRADNPAAQALYHKYDFVEEGRLRGYAFRDGGYADVVAMARLREPLR